MQSYWQFLFITVPVTNVIVIFLTVMALTTVPFAYFRMRGEDKDKDNYWKDMKNILSIWWTDPFYALIFPTRRNYNRWTAYYINQVLTS